MRDRDVRRDIQARLQATGYFDGVWLSGPPEDYGQSTSQLSAVTIEPGSWRQQDLWDNEPDGGLLITATARLTFYLRMEDPQLRDDAAELLVLIAANALNGQSLANLTLPAMTKFGTADFQDPAPPERKIKAPISYQYIVEGWANFDTTT
jgi:hypothetical protein